MPNGSRLLRLRAAKGGWPALFQQPDRLNGNEAKTVAKFLTLWDLDMARVPVDPKERTAGWTMLMGMVEDELKKGKAKDWGNFAGTSAGYSISEGTEEEVHISNMKKEVTP